MVASLAPACYFISVKQQWPLDGGLTASTAKAPDSYDQAEQLDSEAQTGPSGVKRALIGPLCMTSVIALDNTEESKGLFVYRSYFVTSVIGQGD